MVDENRKKYCKKNPPTLFSVAAYCAFSLWYNRSPKLKLQTMQVKCGKLQVTEINISCGMLH